MDSYALDVYAAPRGFGPHCEGVTPDGAPYLPLANVNSIRRDPARTVDLYTPDPVRMGGRPVPDRTRRACASQVD